ncbi:Pilus biogenesis protein, TadE family [Vulgatibacter incomptus]|uniref:Pilus biogenesis protein, TadE family n=1 Tax=Vulgatibacter incomptus TaxID=1391653 RepID=A0A0K1PIG8_9BACT|nr:Pilus biogenesis protein, TadE family [Vulgatibacter incomptus]
MVELALIAPILLAMLLWGTYHAELWVARIKQQEVTRFLAWELTSHPLSDLERGRHAESFERAKTAAVSETRRRYANLAGQSHDERPRGVLAVASLPEDALSLEPVGVDASRSLERPDGAPGGLFDQVASFLGRTQRPVLQRFGLNLDHAGASVAVKLTVRNRLMPRSLLGVPLFPEALETLHLEESIMTLEVDTWNLPDGGDVDLTGTVDGRPSAFLKQVDRIALLGLGDELQQRAGGARKVLDWFPIRPGAQLVSQGYGGGATGRNRSCSANELAASGKWKNGGATQVDRMSPVKCFDTLPIDADKLGAGYRGDPSFRILEGRRNHYMGCRVAGGPSAECDP